MSACRALQQIPCSAVSSSASSLKASILWSQVRMRRYPFAAKIRAMAAPIPRDAPVMRVVLPVFIFELIFELVFELVFVLIMEIPPV
jgi:hypothetical protein